MLVLHVVSKLVPKLINGLLYGLNEHGILTAINLWIVNSNIYVLFIFWAHGLLVKFITRFSSYKIMSGIQVTHRVHVDYVTLFRPNVMGNIVKIFQSINSSHGPVVIPRSTR